MSESFFEEKGSYPDYFEHVLEKLTHNRILFISTEINVNLASSIVAALLFLDKKNHKPISIYINCLGGDIGGLLAIYDVMQLVKSPIKTICVGEASSAAAIILSAGSKGMRYATENSRVMIHQLWVSGLAGTGTDIEIEAKNLQFMKKQLTELLSKHTGQTYNKVYNDCEQDKYLSAKEAKEYGIIDEILKPNKIIPKLKTDKRLKKTPT